MKIKTAMLSVLLILFFINSNAQEKEKKFSFELNLGTSFATKDLGDANLKTAFGSEFMFHYQLMSHMGAYLGWGYNKFSAETSFAGNSMDFEETGYILGIQFKHPIANSPLSYFLRAGGMYSHIEIENEEGEIIENTGHGLGWQVGAGIDIPLSSKWSLTPSVKYSALSRESEIEGMNTPLDLNYFSVRIGITKKF